MIRVRWINGQKIEGCHGCIAAPPSRLGTFIPAAGFGDGLTAAHLDDIRSRRTEFGADGSTRVTRAPRRTYIGAG